MKDLVGKTALITGGASGIGLAMAELFGQQGMNIVIADIEPDALTRVVGALRDRQVRAEGVVTDVTSRDSIGSAALAAVAAFGKIHLLCNNAGVAPFSPFGALPERDWNWVIDVNLKGVVHGVEVIAPLIASHGEGGHIVNTASMAGHYCPPGLEAYCATKYAVVAMSEGWRAQLAASQIGVSVLCPGVVTTNIFNSARNRPAAYGAPTPATAESLQSFQETASVAISASAVAARVLEGVLADELYLFTHVEFQAVVEDRFQRIFEAFDRAETSPALADAR